MRVLRIRRDKQYPLYEFMCCTTSIFKSAYVSGQVESEKLEIPVCDLKIATGAVHEIKVSSIRSLQGAKSLKTASIKIWYVPYCAADKLVTTLPLENETIPDHSRAYKVHEKPSIQIHLLGLSSSQLFAKPEIPQLIAILLKGSIFHFVAFINFQQNLLKL